MADQIIVYKIYCESEQAWRLWYLPDSDPVPTTCPNNTLHNVTAESVSVDRKVDDSAPIRNNDGILFTIPRPSSISYEMCDRDILIKTGIVDTRAQLIVLGAGPEGHIAYSATNPGSRGNDIYVEHTQGATGPGNENRALGTNVIYANNTVTLQVVYGTDGSGNAVVPYAGQVAQMLSQDYTFLIYAFPTLLGDGSDLISVQSPTPLQGGASPSLDDIKINTSTFKKSQWRELQQFGCFKEDGQGGYAYCTDQADADANACLTIWRYMAHSQTTGAPTVIEVRDGLLIVDPTTSDSLEHQAYAVGAPQIPASLGGSVVLFDAYLRFYRGETLGVTSPQAKEMTVDGPGGLAAAELRVYLYYPAGTKNEHILRLVTYRPPGTF